MTDLRLVPDDIDWPHYMRESEAEAKVKPASHWDDELIDEFSEHHGGTLYPSLPWHKLRERVAIRPGEVSLWFGFNGHGKSLILGQAVLGLCAQDEKACVASFEMRPRKTLARMCRQFVDSGNPSPSEVRGFTKWAQGRLWLYDQTSTVEPERVYAVIRYAADRLKCTQLVVDNLTKCVAADDDYTGQKQVVDKLTALAQALNVHIHLVHHARKDRDESRPPRKMDALGASAITNLVDNVFIVWRNKPKQDKPEEKRNEPDAIFICDKQRHGTGWEGQLNLTYHQRSQQYIEGGSSAMRMAEAA